MKFPSLLLVLTACLLVVRLPCAATTETECDVLVYGATPAGFCAAIAAAREGARVVLLEPTQHIGGVNTGGLSFSDSNQTMRTTVMGLFAEWHGRIEKDYEERGVALPYKVAEKNHAAWTYEPGVAMRVTRQMLHEAKITVLKGRALKSVHKEGTRILRLVTTDGEFRAAVFVDATYEGDLMAAAGVPWTIGREGKNAFGEALAGKQYPKAIMPISGYDAEGRRLPLLTASDAGPEDDGDKNVMVYSFRLCLTKDPANRVEFPLPAAYDPARFEVVRRYFAQEKRPIPLWDLYPLPNGKFDANNGIGKQFSMGLVGAGNGWCEASAEDRAKIWEAHRQYTLELYHFLTTDPAVPEAVRNQLTELGLCRDEFPESDHWSPQLYVREGRRMQGIYVLSQKDIAENPAKDDPIIVSSFPIDSHDCQRIALPGGGVVNEGTIPPVRLPDRRHGAPYQVPYRSILPRAEDCENLLVPVALSATHVAYSSIRVEPTWMILGQSVGIAAALSARQKTIVQALPYPALRERLLAQGQVLDLPVLPEIATPAPAAAGVTPAKLPGIVLDDAQAELRGSWSHSSTFKPHIGTGYIHDNQRGDGESVAVFHVKVPRSGPYLLNVAYSPHPTRAANVPILVQSGGKTTRLEFDETKPLPEGQAFRSAGIVNLQSDGETTITMSNTGTKGFVIVDAIQLFEMKE